MYSRKKLIVFSILITVETLVVLIGTIEQTGLEQSSAILQTSNDNNENYENPNLKIKLQYPSEWRIFESDAPALSNLKGIVSFELLPQEKKQEQNIAEEVAVISIIAEDTPSNNITLDQFTKIQYDNFRQLFSDFNFRLENKTAVTIGDSPAEKFEYTIVNPYSDVIRNGMIIWSIRGDTAYMISYVGEQIQYFKYLPAVQMLINSIEFTNGQH